MAQTGVFVPVSGVFPEISSDFDTFRDLLRRLSRTDTLFWCARFNLILSNPANTDHRGKQQYIVSMCLSTEEIDRLNHFVQRHGGVEQTVVFFRGQLLELLRWSALLCQDHPDDGDTFERPELQRAFAQAALIASDLWAQRVYRGNLSLDGGLAAARERALASLRQSIAETSSGMEPLPATGRGKALIVDRLPRFYPSLPDEFRQRTGLSLDDYYLCLAMMTQFLDITPENVEAQSLGFFNMNTVSRNVPTVAPIISIYLQMEAQSPDDLSHAMAGRFEPDGTPPNYRELRRRPILAAPDGRAIIMDPVFFAENAAVGPLFVVSEGADKRESQKIFSAFGNAFELYAGETLRSMYPPPRAGLVDRLTVKVRGRNRQGSEVEIADALLNDVSEAVLIEAKAKWLRDDAALDPDHETYLEELRKKYGVATAAGSKPTGVAQLARSITNLASGDWTPIDEDLSRLDRILPVLLVHDPSLGAPVHSQFLACEFAAALQPDEATRAGDMRKGRFRVTPLTLMTIEDLETLETSTRNFSLRDLLDEYDRACPDRMDSLKDFIARSRFGEQLHHSKTIAQNTLSILKEVLARAGAPEENAT